MTRGSLLVGLASLGLESFEKIQTRLEHGSVEKQTSFGILDNPSKTFLEVRPCYSTTPVDVPFVRLDGIQFQSLNEVSASGSNDISRACVPVGSLPHPYTHSRLSCWQRQANWPQTTSKPLVSPGVLSMATMHKPPPARAHVTHPDNPLSSVDLWHLPPISTHLSSRSSSSSKIEVFSGHQHPLKRISMWGKILV
jgi:hypothetical protein